MSIKLEKFSGTLDELVKLEEETWPEGTRASREAFESRMQHYPEGIISARVLDSTTGKYELAGLSTSMMISWDKTSTIDSWEDVTDYGMIKNHQPEGNALYIVSLGVSPHYRNQKLGSQLVEAQIEHAKDKNLSYVVLGSRIPGFSKTREDMNAEVYVNTFSEGSRIDPEIRFYERNGFNIHRVVENYMEDDAESRNFGVVMYKSIK